MHDDTFNRTLDFNTKLKYFAAAWALIELILVDATYKFLVILQNTNTLHFSQKLSGTELLWGEGLPANMLKIGITCVFAFVFGITFTYLARKVTESDKVRISLINSIVAVFGSTVVILLVLWIYLLITGGDPAVKDSIASITEAISQNSRYVFLILAQLVGAGAFTFIGINTGQKLCEKLDEDDTGKLLGIKWYHYLWLWLGISIYFQALLYVLYMTLHALRIFTSQFRWFELLGATSSDQPTTSLQSLGTTLGFLYVVAAVIVILLNYQRGVLSGERKIHPLLKVLASILISFIVPFLLSLYTVLGRTNV